MIAKKAISRQRPNWRERPERMIRRTHEETLATLAPTLYQKTEEYATMTDDLFAAFNAMDKEDRDMIIEALVIAARRWRRQSADARLAEEIGILDWRLKRSIESKCEKEDE